MSNISKRRKEGSRAKIKSMGDHKEFLKRITKTLYYGQLPSLPCLSLPVTEISCEVWSRWQRGRSVRRLHADAAARISHAACVSPAALVLALLYMERLRTARPDYLASSAPQDLFLITLIVGNKFLQDDGEDEEVILPEWASSAGLDLPQLKRLELEFLNAIDWNIFVNETSFERGLQWLERRVALKQARMRGFFTYADLVAAAGGAGGAGGVLGAALLAASCLAGLLALVASALVLSHAALHRPHVATTAPAPAPADVSAAPLPRPPALPNATDLPTLAPAPAPAPADPSMRERPACCTQWLQHRSRAPPRPERAWAEARWSPPVLGWLYHGPLSPLRRWLERVAEYVELARRVTHLAAPSPPPPPPPHPAPTLDFRKFSAIVVSLSDR